MNQYIINTTYAAENLILIMQKENKALEEKTIAYTVIKDAEKRIFESMKKDGFTPEGIIELLGLSSTSDRIQENDLPHMKALLGTLEDSLNIISGALLQIAKQGISVAHGSPSNCPSGRIIGRETLKSIIWQSRNQAMHFEEGNYNQKVIDCFTNLELDHGVRFKLGNKSLAYEVVKLLQWTSYNNYESDMKLLLPN